MVVDTRIRTHLRPRSVAPTILLCFTQNGIALGHWLSKAQGLEPLWLPWESWAICSNLSKRKERTSGEQMTVVACKIIMHWVKIGTITRVVYVLFFFKAIPSESNLTGMSLGVLSVTSPSALSKDLCATTKRRSTLPSRHISFADFSHRCLTSC